MARPKEKRTTHPGAATTIKDFKESLGITWHSLAIRMDVNNSLLRAYVSMDDIPMWIWNKFLAIPGSIENYHIKVQVWTDETKIKTCACGCGQTFILGSTKTRKWYNRNVCAKTRLK